MAIVEEPGSVCPLTWWSERKKTFPKLSKIAFNVLTIPATSVPSECIFSKAGEMVNKKRNRLHRSTIEIAMLLQTWIKYLEIK